AVARLRFLNCAGDRFTATRTSLDQPAASLQAFRSTHSPSGTMRPVSSASGRNLVKRDHAVGRMVPAHQGLETYDVVRVKIVDRLEIKLEFSIGQCSSQLKLE